MLWFSLIYSTSRVLFLFLSLSFLSGSFSCYVLCCLLSLFILCRFGCKLLTIIVLFPGLQICFGVHDLFTLLLVRFAFDTSSRYQVAMFLWFVFNKLLQSLIKAIYLSSERQCMRVRRFVISSDKWFFPDSPFSSPVRIEKCLDLWQWERSSASFYNMYFNRCKTNKQSFNLFYHHSQGNFHSGPPLILLFQFLLDGLRLPLLNHWKFLQFPFRVLHDVLHHLVQVLPEILQLSKSICSENI